MQGPAQITVTPDGATILVVDTLTEEVLFIDAANLTKKATLKGKDSTVNFTIFNKPVLSPDGSTGIVAARTANTVLHFRTSDGKILAAVDFVSNNIELLTDAFALDAARFISSAEEFTGLTLINLSDKTANFTITALDNYGDAVTGEGIQNPAAYSLPPNNQISLTVAEIFKFDNKEERIGWLAIVSDQPDVAGYLSTGNGAVTNLDGAPLFRGLLHDFIIPEVVRKEGKFAQINFVNPNLNQGATFDLRRILKDGTEQDVKTGQQAFPTNRQPQVFG